MRKTIWVILGLLCFLFTANVRADDCQKTKNFFQNPIVIGASLSAGYAGAPLPEIIQNVFNEGDYILNGHIVPGKNAKDEFRGIILAQGGSRSQPQLEKLLNYKQYNNIEGYSAITALDLFYWDFYFWDTKKMSCIDFLKDIKLVVGKLFSGSTPLVLGTLPLMKFKEIEKNNCVELFNNYLKKKCQDQNNEKCILFDFDSKFNEIAAGFHDDIFTEAERASILTELHPVESSRIKMTFLYSFDFCGPSSL